ncbi:MAG: hypothetical protein ACXQTN_06515, partial [Methanoculleaceae archaeon]
MEIIFQLLKNESMKNIRSSIMQLFTDQRDKSLDQLQSEVKEKLSAKPNSKDLTLINGYLEKLSEQLEKIQGNFAETLELKNGVNVMDLSSMPEPFQFLVINDVLDIILNEETGVICIIPEAWKFI